MSGGGCQNINTLAKARLIAQAASARKAHDIKILDLRRLANFTDYFVLASGDSAPQLRAITDQVVQDFRAKKLRRPRREGSERGGWVLIDCGDVIAHIFHTTTRDYYQLENLWGDAPCETL
ncbi:MAG: ribosome silencing factor [Candidatus Omnitrophica bacterium]|nr:ribosome silencing factor [Candidatus Omnitrophota bacterium]